MKKSEKTKKRITRRPRDRSEAKQKPLDKRGYGDVPRTTLGDLPEFKAILENRT